MRDMKNSGIPWIGEIPKEWAIRKVKHAFVKKSEKAKQDDPIVLSLARSGVRVRDISTNEGQIAESYRDYNPVESGDLLLNPMDLISGANCSMSEIEGVISPAYTNLKANSDVLPKYYDYYFKTQYWTLAFFNHGKGVSYENRWTLTNETLMNYQIPFPKFSLQQQIAHFLEMKSARIDTAIDKHSIVIEMLKDYKQRLITKAVTMGLNSNATLKDSEIEWIGEIPESWRIRRLRFVGSCQNGISKGGESFGSGHPFVSYGDVYKNEELPEAIEGLVQTNASERKNCSVEEGDIFFTRTSETIEEVGLVSVCMKTIPEATFAGFLIRFRPSYGMLFKGFSKYYFQSEIHRRYFVKEMNLVIRASLSQELLKGLPVLLPPMEEQIKIAEYLEKKSSLINRIIMKKQDTIQNLIEYKKSLIYECVTGKREV